MTEEIAQICNYELLIDTLLAWVSTHREKIEHAYLSFKGKKVRDENGKYRICMGFVVERTDVEYDSQIEDDITDIELEISRDEKLNDIYIDSICLPRCSEDGMAHFAQKENSVDLLHEFCDRKLKPEICKFFEENDGEIISYDTLMKKFPLFHLMDIVYTCNLLEEENKIGNPDIELVQTPEQYALDFLCESKQFADLMSQRLSSMISALEYMKSKKTNQ